MISAVMREMGKRGAAARWAKYTAAERRAYSEMLNAAREKKRKKSRKLLKTKGK